MPEVVIVEAVRTPVGRRNGGLSSMHSIDLLGARDDGVDADRQLSLPGSTPDAPVLDLEADIAVGDIQVQRG